MLTTGKWSLPPDYHMENYFPEAEYRPDMHYGAFIQLWSTRYGRGRVLAIADSTLFSNFCTFEPGKSELMLGMLEWLNRSSRFDHWGVRLLFWLLLGLAVVAGLGLRPGWSAGSRAPGRAWHARPAGLGRRRAGRAGDPAGRHAWAADRAAAGPRGRRSHGLRGEALLQRLHRPERQRLRLVGTVDPAAGLFSRAAAGPKPSPATPC